jgi:hypothetical protein
MVPWKHGKANRGHSCVKGRFAYGYATHQDRILHPMIRETIADPWREVSWDEAIGFAATRLRALQETARPQVHRRHHLEPLHERGDLPRPEARPRGLRQQQHRHLRAGLPFAHGLRAGPDLRDLGGTQDFDSVEHTDVVVIIGANPTDGHPVFASRLKKRLRAGAKLIVIDPRRIDLVRDAACPGGASPAPPPRHQRGRGDRHGACDRDRGADGRGLHPRALRLGRVRGVCRVRRRPAPFARGDRASDRRARGRPARRRAALCHRRQRGDLLRPRRDRAQPGLDHRHRHREPRHADRQRRPRGRGREPAARPEQRAGLLRHGVVPARAAGLPAPQERRCARHVRGCLGVELDPEPGCASPTCSTPR